MWVLYFLLLVVVLPLRATWWDHRTFSTFLRPSPLFIVAGLFLVNYAPQVFQVVDIYTVRRVFWTSAGGILYLLLYYLSVPHAVSDAHSRVNVSPVVSNSRPVMRYLLTLIAIPVVLVPLWSAAALVPGAKLLLPDWAARIFQSDVRDPELPVEPTTLDLSCDMVFKDEAYSAYVDARRGELKTLYPSKWLDIDAIVKWELQSLVASRECLSRFAAPETANVLGPHCSAVWAFDVNGASWQDPNPVGFGAENYRSNVRALQGPSNAKKYARIERPPDIFADFAVENPRLMAERHRIEELAKKATQEQFVDTVYSRRRQCVEIYQASLGSERPSAIRSHPDTVCFEGMHVYPDWERALRYICRYYENRSARP